MRNVEAVEVLIFYDLDKWLIYIFGSLSYRSTFVLQAVGIEKCRDNLRNSKTEKHKTVQSLSCSPKVHRSEDSVVRRYISLNASHKIRLRIIFFEINLI